MADKSSRLSDILKQEYQSKGIVGGLASATGKRIREKLDIRNALFGGSGVGSLIGRKVFGKGYSAIADKSSADKLSSQTAPILAAQSDKLDVISTNTQITAKNSMTLPSMARDMNVMRQNIIKMVKLQGGAATNKADAFFSKSKDRESMYESLFTKKEKTKPVSSPIKVDNKNESGGFLSTIMGLGASIVSTIGGAITGIGGALLKIPGMIAEVFSVANISKLFGVGTNVLGGLARILSLMTNPTFLAIAAAIGGAVWLVDLITRKNAEANTEDKINARKNQDRGSNSSKLAARTLLIDEGLKSLLGEKYTDKDVSDYTRGEITSKEELKKKIAEAQAAGKNAIEITNSGSVAQARYAQMMKDNYVSRAGTGRDMTPTPVSGVPSLEQIGQAESGKMGYDAANKGKAGDMPNGMPGLSSKKVGEIMKLQSEKQLFAAGRYQIIPETLKGLVDRGIVSMNDTFDKATQDKLGQALYDKRIAAAGNDPIKQQLELSKEWAAIANPYTGVSYYAGVGNNKATLAGLTASTTGISGSTLASSSSTIEDIIRNLQIAQAPVVNIDNSQRNTTSSGGGASLGQAEVIDLEIAKLLTRMSG